MIKLIHGDFRDYPELFTEDVFVVSDPPYNQNYHYSEYDDKLTPDEYKQLLADAFKGNKSVVIMYPEPTINILSKILDDCRELVSWVYNSNTAKQNRSITWWGCKPDFRKDGQPYKNPKDKRIAKRIAEGKQARLYDWWEINQVKNVSKKDNTHPCPVPLELMERIIKITTNEGDTIIDPFMGSGTTGVACRNLNRNFIGMELDREYFEIAKRRIDL